MKLLPTFAVAAAIVLSPLPVFAEQVEFSITNLFPIDLSSVSVKPGKVTGFKPIMSGQVKSFTITTPDGVCEVKMTVVFKNGQSSTDVTDICKYNSTRFTGLAQ